MRYVRKEQKKDDKGAQLFNTSNVHESEKVYFPKIEEYFMYTPEPRYPTNMAMGGAGTAMKGVKLAKDSITSVSSPPLPLPTTPYV